MSRLPFQCIRLLCLAAAATAFYPSSAARADSFSFSPLPAVPFEYAVEPKPFGIDGNRVVGTYYNEDSEYDHGFYYDGSSYTELGEDVDPYGISGNTIVGRYNSQGFTYDIPTMQFQYSQYGSYDSWFNAIDGSNIVGTYFDYTTFPSRRGFLYDGSAYTPIDPSGFFGVAGSTYLTAIHGDLVGGYFSKNIQPYLPESPFTYQISTGQYSEVVLPAAFSADGNATQQLTGISDQLMVGTYVSSLDGNNYIWLYDRAEGQFSSATPTDATWNGVTGGASGNKFVGYADDLTNTQIGYVAAFSAVPEIDPAGMGSVLALVTGALGLIERRRLKAKAAA